MASPVDFVVVKWLCSYYREVSGKGIPRRWNALEPTVETISMKCCIVLLQTSLLPVPKHVPF